MVRTSPHYSSPVCSFNDRSIDCKGSCRQRFHAVCVGLPAASVPMIAASSSFFWFCDVCRDHIRTGRKTVAVLRPDEGSPAEKQSCGSTSCIYTDQLVACDGPCRKNFHGMCVELSKTDLSVIDSSSNIVWFCDECKLNEVPVLDYKITSLENPPDSLPNSEGINCEEVPVVETPEPNDEDRGNDRGTSASSTNSDESGDYDDSAMEDSSNIADVPTVESPKDRQNVPEPGVQPQTETATLTPPAPIKPEEDETKTSPQSKKRPLITESPVEPIAPKSVKKNDSVFSMYLRFSVPNMSDLGAERAVRSALGMSHREPVTAWSVTPHRVVFPRYSTFRVDLDARWKSAALEDSTWRCMANYEEHREWFAVKSS
uniref:(northern house mosquito) hypothetical protein n=1 Tax=Culex pipiens TaxID=7175 RepID=A0A8D8ATG5_CULPI